MNELVSKIGKVEQLELFPAEEFADTPDETLAEWINTGHAAIKMAVRRLAIHVAQVGAWLVAAKAQCQHGEWLNWLSENCSEISQRTAYNYMETYEELKETNLQLLANLTPIQAYRHIGIVKDPTDKLEVETPLLPEGKYNVIYADPPWEYSQNASKPCQHWHGGDMTRKKARRCRRALCCIGSAKVAPPCRPLCGRREKIVDIWDFILYNISGDNK